MEQVTPFPLANSHHKVFYKWWCIEIKWCSLRKWNITACFCSVYFCFKGSPCFCCISLYPSLCCPDHNTLFSASHNHFFWIHSQWHYPSEKVTGWLQGQERSPKACVPTKITTINDLSPLRKNIWRNRKYISQILTKENCISPIRYQVRRQSVLVF